MRGLGTYTRTELLSTLRDPSAMFFTVVMPLMMFTIFGVTSSFASQNIKDGVNVSAVILVSMATYSAAAAGAAFAAQMAVELSTGWGRQVALSSGGMKTYLTAKLLSTLLMSMLPVAVLFAVGAATESRMPSLQLWLACAVLCCLAALPCALFGIFVGMVVPANSAAGIAASAISLFAFLGNMFMPLGGKLLQFSQFTPLYGINRLVQWPLVGGTFATTDGLLTQGIGQQVANLVAWILIFAGAALLALRLRGRKA
ncbi:hypothetical protein ACUH9Y_07960 [Dermabacteraceae bacterium P13115]|nr:hypothetical protein [Dermabacteraceae bacterium TAE3-ERU5]